MSRPQHYWYGIVKTMIMESPNVVEHSLQTTIIENAMRDAKRETLQLQNGALRMKAVNDILIEKKANYDGVALEVHYDWHTVQKWVNSYVNLVGKKAGY